MSCHCGSGQNFSNCCEPYITGQKAAPTPEALMRSRYSAHVISDIAYIKNTVVPEKRAKFNEADVKAWAQSEWLGLNVLSASGNTVEFIAKYRKKGRVIEHHEVSKFKNIDGKWYFLDGDSHEHEEGQGHHHHAPQTPVVREEPKVGRNDPCPCGSGKKYKKCCAA